MELRHLRYFVAVAEEGSVTVAAERLHTSQPSLSRQIRDLEYEVGAELLTRGARGVELTAAGRAFLDHARLALAQADAAGEAARRAAQPARTTFAIGFQTGHEMNWLPPAMHILRDELHHIEVKDHQQLFARPRRCARSWHARRGLSPRRIALRSGIPGDDAGAAPGADARATIAWRRASRSVRKRSPARSSSVGRTRPRCFAPSPKSI
jgi:molybdenum-dependent DNA-binding transcriptional regulator ModE